MSRTTSTPNTSGTSPEKLGEEAAAVFDRACGLVPDPAKLYWYRRLLDEAF